MNGTGVTAPSRSERLERWLGVPTAYLPHPDATGNLVRFISDPAGWPQAWSVPLSGGDPRRLLDSDHRVGAVHPSPVTQDTILAVDSGGNEHWQLLLLPAGEGAGRPEPVALTAAPSVIHGPAGWRPDGRGYVFTSNARDGRFFDVHEIDPAKRAPVRTLWQSDSWADVLDVGADGILVARRNTNLDADLFVVGPESTVPLNPHDGEVTVHSGALSAGSVFAASNPGRELCALIRFRPSRAGHEFLREYDGEVELVRSSPDGDRLLVLVNRQGWSEAHLLDLSTNEDRALTSGPRGVIGSMQWLRDGSGYVYDISTTEGVEVYRRNLATGKEKRLVAANPGPPEHLPVPRLTGFSASDGVRIPYWEYTSASAPSRGTILHLHGGPESQARPSFSPLIGHLASSGWRVIAPNVRGSSGYGRTFVHLDDVGKRMDSVRDLRDLAAHLVRERKATPGRLGLVGGSYGGFMVLSAAATYPELWGAAVDIVGISNFVTFLEETGAWRRTLREAEYGSLERDRELLRAISPLHSADKIRAPLLVIHGRNDPRVPLHEAEQIVATLRNLGRQVELMVFDDEGHGLVRRPNRLRAWGRVAEFLEETLADAPPSTAAKSGHGAAAPARSDSRGA